VSKVFQIWRQWHIQRLSARGVHWHLGQRIFGPVGPRPEMSSMAGVVSASRTAAANLGLVQGSISPRTAQVYFRELRFHPLAGLGRL